MSPIAPDYYYVNGSTWDTYTPPTAPTPADYKILTTSISYNAAGTIATVTVIPATLISIGSYGGAVAGSSTFNDPDFVVNSNTNTLTIGSVAYPLTPGSLYKLRVRAYSGANQTGVAGEYFYETIAPPKPSAISSVVSTTSKTQTPSDTWDYDAVNRAILNKILAEEAAAAKADVDVTGNSLIPESTGVAYATKEGRTVSRSLFTITNNSKDNSEYSVALKDTNISTGYDYFSFGTSVFFSSNLDKVQGAGGIGFFTSNSGMTGYFILVQTTSNLADTADKEIQIWKLVNGKKIKLNDSQSGTNGKALSGILGGISYKIDVSVITTNTKRVIDVYVNNFKITATDSTKTGSKIPSEIVLPKTSQVALFANIGSASFDYVYANPLTQKQFEAGILQNLYTGKYGTKTLDFLYGDKIVSSTISSDQISFLEDFGTVAREIKRLKIKYQDRPGYPLFTSTGINRFAQVLGQRLTSFGAELYVINNSGTFVPLDDQGLYSFSVIGNYIVTSGQHEYVSNTVSENTVVEPAVFEASWIQSESDAKNLTKWIEAQWSKQQSVVDLEIFSNPLISVGDIVSINYPKNNLSGTEKFVVTNVRNSFEGGLSTSITARSIFS